jgi:hypothetical protein
MWWLVPQPQTHAQNEYAASLYARLDECSVLRRAEVKSESWRPQANDCHANVSEWCIRYPEYEIVRGWLYFHFEGALGRVQFLAHSAVRAPDGLLYDITPSYASQDYPFLSAKLSENDFAALVQGGTTRLWHTPA